ncbi:type II toxin-antitoxin system RelE/ParE family toxin [Phyllobacterium sp. YR531]|uniref:type II toxin-antitoxin system RelE/ParE family toxin n=1 Tax=Phyllobacterium sp. YR531 TaxID=1144343 RepID=UPI00026F5BD1|nr:type II toxin-antitoxin system RelE/ParE family toxin [Phyllobacterium sp. YR531]EJM98737.1 putative addiction module killer protein [Phyllobacterium sp. YR531]
MAITIQETDSFYNWVNDLRDLRARIKIYERIDRLAGGNPGDSKSVGEGIIELRINYGPGYRVYFLQRGHVLIILLCGGDKNTQDRDIKKAKVLANSLKGKSE